MTGRASEWAEARRWTPLVGLLALSACGGDGAGPMEPLPGSGISSTFSSSDEGWQVVGDPAAGPLYHPSGGNPGGYISAVDRVTGDTWYWRAPVLYRGDRAAAYRGVLRFDLKQSSTTKPFDAHDVILAGEEITLIHNLQRHPGTNWTTFTVRLDETADWTVLSSGEPAKSSQIRAVLSDLRDLRIRGEYEDGQDEGGLDNVFLGVI